jgi:hypothetical protein
LPFSAYESQLWWEHEKEGNHVNTRAWSNAGWKVDEVNLKEEWVLLVRSDGKDTSIKNLTGLHTSKLDEQEPRETCQVYKEKSVRYNQDRME